MCWDGRGTSCVMFCLGSSSVMALKKLHVDRGISLMCRGVKITLTAHLGGNR